MSKKPDLDPVDVMLTTPRFEDDLEAFVKKAVEAQFPDAATIEMIEPYMSPFRFPEFLDQEEYNFCWVDLRDDRCRHDAEAKFWALVTRSSSCVKSEKVKPGHFRSHGAVEVLGQFLHFRPIDLDRVMRGRPAKQHLAIAGSMEGTKREKGYELNVGKRGMNDDELDNERMTKEFAYEKAGEEGMILSE